MKNRHLANCFTRKIPFLLIKIAGSWITTNLISVHIPKVIENYARRQNPWKRDWSILHSSMHHSCFRSIKGPRMYLLRRYATHLEKAIVCCDKEVRVRMSFYSESLCDVFTSPFELRRSQYFRIQSQASVSPKNTLLMKFAWSLLILFFFSSIIVDPNFIESQNVW